MRSIWLDTQRPGIVHIIDQRKLPHRLATLELHTWQQAADAIKDMAVRGAPLIGVTAAWGLALAARTASLSDKGLPFILQAADALRLTRPTAVNLAWALDRVLLALRDAQTPAEREALAALTAQSIMEEDVQTCAAIGQAGLPLIEEVWKRTKAPVQIMTHCNAGWLACVDHGTATAPIYEAHRQGIPVHVWVSETRPRLQGALTAWELFHQGVPHTVIADNAAGLLLQQGKVDLVIVGCDRATATGDAANKIGTYLKALAAAEHAVPFYVALPLSTFDLSLRDGPAEIPIEARSEKEVLEITGAQSAEFTSVQLFPMGSSAINYGFDVTPARFITQFITEKGLCPAQEGAIAGLFR